MSESNINLKENNSIITNDPTVSYEILNGSVNLYIAPNAGDHSARRLFLCELKKGDIIPTLSEDAPVGDLDDIKHFNLVIVAKESTLLAEIPYSQDHLNSLKPKLKLNKIEKENFGNETLIEKYRINIAVNLRNIYTNSKENKDALTNSFEAIISNFHKTKIMKNTIHTNYNLYNAVYLYCALKGIDLPHHGEIKKICGSRYSLNELASVASIPMRKIVLPNGWFNQDLGHLLAFDAKDHTPLVLIPRGNHSYNVYNTKTSTLTKITADNADEIDLEAYILYKDFPNKPMSFFDLFKFGFKELKASDFVYIVLLAIVGILIGLLIPYMNEQLYDLFIPLGDVNGLIGVGIVILSCMIGNVSFAMVKKIAIFKTDTKMKYAIDNAVISRLFNIKDSDFRKESTATVLMRSQLVSATVSAVYNLIITQGLTALLSCAYLFSMYNYYPKLATAGIIMTLVLFVVIVIIGYLQYKVSAKYVTKNQETSTKLYQYISGINKIKNSNSRNRVLYEYTRENSKAASYNHKLERLTAISQTILTCSTMIFSLVLYYYLIVKTKNIAPGKFIGFNSAFGSFTGAFNELALALVTVFNAIPNIKFSEIITKSVPEVDDSKEIASSISGAIDIDNLSFAYDDGTIPVLDGINLHIDSGEYIGIVGSSGCGKSTLIKLLLGFETPTEGKIYYDNKDLEKLNKRELRKLIGSVLQGGALISGSIFENINITNYDLTFDKAMNLIEKIGLKEDIDAMPMGLNTMVSNESMQISGGQKQRILIARAIANNPNILIFDEATSALDNVTQAKISENLDELECTRIMVAHRLSTIINCDRILVMDKGKIVEEGSYDELMAKQGFFYELARRQI